MNVSPRKAARADYENNLTVVKKEGLTAVGFLVLTRRWQGFQWAAVSFAARVQASLLQEGADCDAVTRPGSASSLDGKWRSDANAADGCAEYVAPRPSFRPATGHRPPRQPTITTTSRWPPPTTVVRHVLGRSYACIAIANHRV